MVREFMFTFQKVNVDINFLTIYVNINGLVNDPLKSQTMLSI